MSSAHRYTIVVGPDFSAPAGAAIDQALELLERRDAELHVVYVHPETWIPSARNGSFVGPGDAETLQKMQIVPVRADHDEIRVQVRGELGRPRMAPTQPRRAGQRLPAMASTAPSALILPRRRRMFW